MKRLKAFWSNLKECREIFFPQKEKSADDFSTLELLPVKIFLEDFVGVIIVDFNSFNDNIKDIGKNIQAKMVVSVEIKDKDLWLKLAKINGAEGGYLKISPTIFGQFAEGSDKEQPMVDALYHIVFYGGVVLEYTDFKGQGTISYHLGLPAGVR